MEKLKASDYLSAQDRKELLEKNDLKAVVEILHTWLWIAFAFALVYYYPNVLTILASLFILGGKQLACAIIMHDASHYSLFRKKQYNDFVGNWFGGYAILNDLSRYRPYHNEHHIKTGTEEDPDLSLTKGYPTSAVSMFRKIVRDLSGATGVKTQFALLAIHLGIIKYTLAKEVIRIKHQNVSFGKRAKQAFKNLIGPICFQLILFGILYAIGQPLLYLLWIGALLTTFNFSLRIRSMAEHSMVENSLDEWKNTRTIYANFFEKILFAPHNVNFHVEHHLMMAVPPYNLPKMHEIIKKNGFYEKGLLEKNYIEIIKLAIGRKK